LGRQSERQLWRVLRNERKHDVVESWSLGNKTYWWKLPWLQTRTLGL
jgi:hypothetical protein